MIQEALICVLQRSQNSQEQVITRNRLTDLHLNHLGQCPAVKNKN